MLKKLEEKIIEKLLSRRWNKFPETKPKKNGWYQCTILYVLAENNGYPEYSTYVMDLFWYGENERWKDNRRSAVYNERDVYLSYEFDGHGNPLPLDQRTKQYNDSLCDRTDSVIAWQPMTKPLIKKGINYYDKEV